jgi:hypothetical protein
MSKLKAVCFALVFIGPSAWAECRKANVCDDYGRNCRIEQVCEGYLDLPSIELDPLPSLPTLELKPLPSLELPPIGTTHCEYQQVNGKWRNICR